MESAKESRERELCSYVFINVLHNAETITMLFGQWWMAGWLVDHFRRRGILPREPYCWLEMESFMVLSLEAGRMEGELQLFCDARHIKTVTASERNSLWMLNKQHVGSTPPVESPPLARQVDQSSEP